MRVKREPGEREIVARLQIPPTPLAACEPPGPCCRDHRGVIGIEPRGSYAHRGLSRQPRAETGGECTIAGHASTDHGSRVSDRLDRMSALCDEHLQSGVLEGAGQVRSYCCERVTRSI